MNKQPMGLAVITGASSGIGAVYADRLARRGYDLLLVARNQERMADLAKKLVSETGGNVEILAAELTDSNHLAELERILREDSRVTLLVNNAGVGATEPLLNSDVAAMSRMIALNVEALTRLAYATVPGLRETWLRRNYQHWLHRRDCSRVAQRCVRWHESLCAWLSANRCGMSWSIQASKFRSCCPGRLPQISGTPPANRLNICRRKS
jgi:NAD(P)-dependent dehydrogenase (short-subunit alcohol dehydrogenase family)